jgi:hypothetical protein
MAYTKREFKNRSPNSSISLILTNFDTAQSAVIAVKFQYLQFDPDEAIVNASALDSRGVVVTQGNITGKVFHYDENIKRLHLYDVCENNAPGGTFATGAVTWPGGGSAVVESVGVSPVYLTSVEAFISKGTVTLSWGGGTPTTIFPMNTSFNYGRKGNNFAVKNDAGTPDGTIIITTEEDFTEDAASYSVFIECTLSQTPT